jgi:hypothetical protein
MGVAGASVDSHGILVTGLAGLLAGACSMALGEWVSVTSARELAQREIRIESSELAEDPEGEGEELKLIYEAKGLSPSEAETMVRHLLADRSNALDALARQELGIDPKDLGGSAREAAIASFVLFAIRCCPTDPPILCHSWGHRGDVKRRDRCPGTLRDWGRNHAFYGDTGVAIGRTSTPAGPRSGRGDVRRRQANRHRDRRLMSLKIAAHFC